jgi:hypothetical protein
VVELVGETWRLPALCTVPIPWLIETLLDVPLISQRKVADWPRWMELGSAVNWATVGAEGAGGGGAGVAAGGGGGGGGAGTFFLHPAANSANETARPMIVIFRLSNMNMASSILN